jgi:hypothetical protein
MDGPHKAGHDELGKCLGLGHAQKRIARPLTEPKPFLAHYRSHEPGMDRRRIYSLLVRDDRADAIL